MHEYYRNIFLCKQRHNERQWVILLQKVWSLSLCFLASFSLTILILLSLCSLCCTCGVPIPPNPANMCVSCLRTQVDISEGIPKQVSVHFCKQCERYLFFYLFTPVNNYIYTVLHLIWLISQGNI